MEKQEKIGQSKIEKDTKLFYLRLQGKDTKLITDKT